MAYPGAVAQWTQTPDLIHLAEAKGRLNCLPRVGWFSDRL
jgi:hypothetical protein